MITACFIVKNEEKWLEGCLTNIQPIVTEIVVVDTGSSDRTKEIASKFGAKIFDFKWTGDFSAARNFSLQYATQPWILNFDPDERLAPQDLKRVQELTQKTDVHGFSFRIRNYSNDSSKTFFSPCRGEYAEFEAGHSGYFETQRVKLFQNGRGIHFVGAVHELLESTIQGPIETPQIPIHHFGELPEEKTRKAKHSTYFPILIKKVADYPSDWKNHFELGTEYIGIENFHEALKCFEKALTLSSYPQIYSHLGHCYFVCGREAEAEVHFRKGMQEFPREHDIRFNFASMRMSQNRWPEAVEILNPLLTTDPDSFLALRALGYCLLNQGQLSEAEVFFMKALKLFPAFEDARVDLGIVRFLQGNKTEAIDEAKKVLAFHPGSQRAEGLLKAIDAQQT